MNENKNSTFSLKLWIIFGLFVGLIVYEVRQFRIAIKQRGNFEYVRKKQSEELKKVFDEIIEFDCTQKESN
tara:strand:- start:10519 stop:10731 length:213 start_codon:yes stop_codon:yes gene_type:complete